MTDETRYDQVPYPAGLYETTHPSHLAALSRLHGLRAPDPATARVLEIAGGDGVNLIGMAAACPNAHFHSFDLSAAAVDRGAALARAAGLANVRIETGDVIALAEEMDETFDYVIVHGLYSWVPEAVRAATLKLIGRVLSPEGVAMVSYNAMPGGHLRMALREMLLHEVRDIADPVARVKRSREILAEFAKSGDADRPALAGMREVAEPMQRKNLGSLYHDELSDHFAPQALVDVVAAAAPHRLAFLNDSMPSMVFDGLPGDGMTDGEVVHAAQADDYRVLAFFHQTLFVRPDRQPRRQIDPACFAGLLGVGKAGRTGAEHFALGDDSFEIVDDAPLADLLGELGAAAPRRLSLAALADSPDRCHAMLQLYQRGAVDLHTLPFPATLDPGERPVASPLARAQIAMGSPMIFTLHHQMIGFAEPGPRAFLSLLDGTRDRATLAADWAATEFGDQVAVEAALPMLAHAGLLLR